MADIRIDPVKWSRLFSEPSFRRGWREMRAGLPIDQSIADVNLVYVYGRLMAAESLPRGLELPDPVLFFSMQMKMVIEACPVFVTDRLNEWIAKEQMKAAAPEARAQ